MPYLWLVLTTLFAACARAAAPTAKPLDDAALRALPASGDYVSAVAVPDWAFSGINGQPSCDYGSMLEVIPDPSFAAEQHRPSPPLLRADGGFGPVFDAPLADGRFAVLERMRGLRVVDPRAAPGAQITSSFALPEGHHPLSLHVTGERAFLVATRDFQREHLVQWLELPRGAQPKLLSELRLPGEARGSYLRAASGQAPRLVVLADVHAARCGERNGSVARVLSIDARTQAIAPAFEQPLGAHAYRVQRNGDWLMVHGRESDEGDAARVVRFFDLDAESAQASLSAPLVIGVGAYGFSAPADAARDAPLALAYFTTNANPEVEERIETHHVMRLRFGLETIQHCTLPLAARNAGPDKGWLEPMRVAQALLLEDQALLVARESNHAASSRVFRVRMRDCAVSEHALAGQHFIAADDGTRLVGLAPHEGPELHAALYALPGFEPRGELHIESAAFDIDHSRFVSARQLAIPYQTIERDALREGDQLLTLERDRLARGAQLDARLRVLEASGAHVLRDPHGLRFEPGPPGLSVAAPTALWTQHVDGELLEPATAGTACDLARIRWPGPAQHFDARGDALEGLLEFVPGDRDPQLGAPTAAFPISGRSRLDRVGSLLVATAQDALSEDHDPRQPCRLEIFDARDLQAVRKTASLVSEELCGNGHELDDQPAFAARDALVFARVVPRYDRPVVHPHGGRVELRVLDLRDPYKPVWLPTALTPQPELALSVHHDGEQLYYAFRLDKLGGSKHIPEAHFYLRRIDLSDPRALRFGERISVPGEPIRLVGRALYARQARWVRDASGKSFEAEHRLLTLELSERDVRELAVIDDDAEAARLAHHLWRESLYTRSHCRGRTLRLDYGVLHFGPAP